MDCGFNFGEKEKEILGIFLSYGLDASEELLRMIRAGLDKHGHDIWFENNHIRFGNKWMIIQKYLLLNVISKYH